ncbi:MAG: hypothetical protein JWM31_1941, partial [Solirubrobacterales bacterium]|nr:hypothetical protein [Solirubrobacterales bacterium]
IARGGWKPPSRLRTGVVARGRGHRHRAGQTLPQPRVRSAGGSSSQPLDDLLGTGYALVGPPDLLRGVSVPPALRGRLVPLQAGDDGGIAAWLTPARVVLVRPDRVVYGTARTAQDVPLLMARAAAALSS